MHRQSYPASFLVVSQFMALHRGAHDHRIFLQFPHVSSAGGAFKTPQAQISSSASPNVPKSQSKIIKYAHPSFLPLENLLFQPPTFPSMNPSRVHHSLNEVLRTRMFCFTARTTKSRSWLFGVKNGPNTALNQLVAG